ncbi:MAG: efflux RND transporter periplasmic adaptor subunit [Rhodopila sp.]
MDELTQDVRRDAIGASRRTERPVKRLLGLTLGALVLIALAVGGTLYWLNARDFETTDDAAVDAYTTQMASRVAGQVLLQIDPRDYQAKVDQARAQQASAEAMLQQARAQVAVQQAAVDQAAANVHVAEAGLVQARQDYERYQKINPNAVTRQQVEAATATFHADQAKLEASRQTVGGAQATLQAAQAQVLAAQASLKQAEANTRAAELQLSYCTIIAPVSGMVTHRTVSAGNYVNPGQALFALVQDDRWVTANFKETQLARIRPGQAVELSVDAIPGVTFRGKVDSFQGGTGTVFSVLPSENATGNYVKIVQRLPVKIVFDDPRAAEHTLAPGMSVVPAVRVR